MSNQLHRVCIKALIKDGDKILMAREPTGVWDLLGGGIEGSESPLECLTREIKEEAGIDLKSYSTQPSFFFTSLSNRGSPVAVVVYEVELESMNFSPSNECEELRFITKSDVDTLKISPSAKKLIELIQDA